MTFSAINHQLSELLIGWPENKSCHTSHIIKKTSVAVTTKPAQVAVGGRNLGNKEGRPRVALDKPREKGKCWYYPEKWTYVHKCNEVKNLLHAIQLQGHSDEENEYEGEVCPPQEN